MFRTGDVLGCVDLIRGLVPEGLMGAVLVVIPEVGPEAPYGRSYALIFFEIYLLVFDRTPEALDEDVVKGPSPAIHTDRNALVLQHAAETL